MLADICCYAAESDAVEKKSENFNRGNRQDEQRIYDESCGDSQHMPVVVACRIGP